MCSEIQSVFADRWKFSACNLVWRHLSKAACNQQSAPKRNDNPAVQRGESRHGGRREVRAPSPPLHLQPQKQEMQLALHLPRLLWVGAPILQSGVFPLHLAGTQRTCNKPHSGCVSPRQCQYMQKHREAFFKAARFMTSHTAAIFQKHLPKNVTSYLNLSTDCIWILICFRNRKRWKLSHPAGSNAEGWTERNRGVPRKTEGTTKKGEK